MRLRLLSLSVLFFFMIPSGVSANQTVDEPVAEGNGYLPVVRIGLLTDGPLLSFPDMVEGFRREIRLTMEDDFEVSFPESMTLQADSTREGVTRQLDTLLNNPETDLVITLGTIGSTEALSRRNLAKPVVAPLVLDAALQKAPQGEIGSGVPNLSYIDLDAAIDKQVIVFRRLVPFKNLGILADERDINGIAAIKKFSRQLANEFSISVHLLPVKNSVNEVINSFPAELDAVIVAPLWQLPHEEFLLLSRELVRRQLPSFSLANYTYVEDGLFATTAPSDILDHLARQASIMVQEILLGENAANLPVSFSKSANLTINMDTARAINIYPSLDYMTGANLINEQRSDIQRKITLPEVINEALTVNLDLAIAEREVNAGTYAVREVKSALFPQVGIGAGGRVIDSDRAAIGGGISPERALIASAAATQQIYSETSWAGYEVEKYRQTGREFNRDSVRLDIIYQASVAYFNVLRQKSVELLQKDNMKLTQANLERAQIRLSTGVAGPDELYRWQTQFANDRQVVLRAESATLDAMQGLNRILDRPLQEEFIAEETDLSDPLMMVGNKLFFQLIHNPFYLKEFNNYAVLLSLDLSPELRIIDAELGAQKRTMLKSRRDYWLPEFTLEGRVDQTLSSSGDGQRDEDFNGLDDTDWSVGVFATLPLFEGGRKSASVGKNQELIIRLKNERRAAEERISQQVLRSLNNTRASYPSINLSRDAADAAKRNLLLVTDSYVQGIKSIVDLLDAQNQAINSDLAASNSVYNFLIDLMGVQRSIGEFFTFLPPQEQKEWLQRAKDYLQQTSLP